MGVMNDVGISRFMRAIWPSPSLVALLIHRLEALGIGLRHSLSIDVLRVFTNNILRLDHGNLAFDIDCETSLSGFLYSKGVKQNRVKPTRSESSKITNPTRCQPKKHLGSSSSSLQCLHLLP
jgi:hypothetical protein